MKANVILAGVGGQGILSTAYCLCNAALKRGLNFKQAEVHGMAQRGGAVVSHLRISPDTIYSDLVSYGEADLLLSIEPLECLRYAQYLSAGGSMVTSCAPVLNIGDYPELDGVLKRVAEFREHILLDTTYLSAAAGSGRAANMVMLGAGGRALGFSIAELEGQVRTLFSGKSERVVEANCKALRVGALAARLYRERLEQGRSYAAALRAVGEIAPAELVRRAEQEIPSDAADGQPAGDRSPTVSTGG
ncbi:MAG TPA: indolepyruvate oxidoreductase subunit beta [Phycisphaerae bacterium]|nr:indolepyruvate oxidoreductase subunit beta [Phycisphaerae bacterium]